MLDSMVTPIGESREVKWGDKCLYGQEKNIFPRLS